MVRPFNRLATVEEQKAYERERIEEARLAREAGGGVPVPRPNLDVPTSHMVKVDLSPILAGFDLKQVARDNGVWKDSYSKLSPAQLRMTIGNILRGRLKKGQSVKIGDTTM